MTRTWSHSLSQHTSFSRRAVFTKVVAMHRNYALTQAHQSVGQEINRRESYNPQRHETGDQPRYFVPREYAVPKEHQFLTIPNSHASRTMIGEWALNFVAASKADVLSDCTTMCTRLLETNLENKRTAKKIVNNSHSLWKAGCVQNRPWAYWKHTRSARPVSTIRSSSSCALLPAS